jgi:hypothetical protein
MALPILCTLTESQLKERRRAILDFIRDNAIEITSIPDGYAYRFKSTSEILPQLSNLVDLERQCCQFLTFKILIEPQQPIKLEVTGPPEATAMITDFFGVVLQSTITCPNCKHAQLETMPADQCVFFYECPGCRSLLRPLPGDCCVFCSYGSVKCPSTLSKLFERSHPRSSH